MPYRLSCLLFLLTAVPLHFTGQIKIENYSLQKPDTNLLYIGIGNKIHISGLKNIRKAKVWLNNNYYTADKSGLFSVNVVSSSPALLQVRIKITIAAAKTFYPARIPEPVILLGNFRDTTLTAAEIGEQDTLRVVLPGCMLRCISYVYRYRITIFSKNKAAAISGEITGGKIPAPLMDVIKKSESGTKILFDRIRIAWFDHTPEDSFSIIIK